MESRVRERVKPLFVAELAKVKQTMPLATELLTCNGDTWLVVDGKSLSMEDWDDHPELYTLHKMVAAMHEDIGGPDDFAL